MSEWQFALLLGAVATATFAAPRNPRGAIWIVIGAASFALTTAYQRAGLPFHPAFTALCDTVTCCAIYVFARYRWEAWLFACFMAMVVVGTIHFIGFPDNRYLYIVLLELCNWAALLVIGSATVGEIWVDGDLARWAPRGRLRRAVRSALPHGWADEEEA